MAERVLVTGAAGFIGSALVERLLLRGDRVIGLDNFDPFYPRAHKERNLATARAHPGFRLVEADCADLATVRQRLAGEEFDLVVHLAAKAGVRPSLRQPLSYVSANVAGTQAILELARERGIERFVFASSSSVYGNSPRVPFSEDDRVDAPISPYAATKVAGELLARTYNHLYGLAVVALRFFTVYGPRQRPDLAIRKFATLMLRDEPIPVFGDGGTRRDYTWIDDILRGVVAAMDYTSTARGAYEIVNLGGNRTTTLKRLIDLVADALGVTPRIERRPPQPGDVERTCADIAKAHRLLGYAPTVTPEEGIPRFVSWLRSYDEEAAPAPALAGTRPDRPD
jgi:UDP-glucuronate 4-epimerase